MTKTSGIEFLLKKLFNENADIFDSHQWPSEDLRWAEFILALLSGANRKHESKMRSSVRQMLDLGLLSIEDLSALEASTKGIDMSAELPKRISIILTDIGFNAKECKKSVSIMHEAAKSVKDRYNGKIQKYLRMYGEEMVKQAQKSFSIGSLSREEFDFAIRLWLQNVLNMPVTLKDENVRAFCKTNEIDQDDLIDAADGLDANLALVDDIIKIWKNTEKQGRTTKDRALKKKIKRDRVTKTEPEEEPEEEYKEYEEAPRELVYDLLIQGNVDGFNEFRQSNPNLKIILRNANLRGISLPGVFLNEADLKEADLSGADLTDAKLIGADLREANLENANLTNADFQNANMWSVLMEGAITAGANFRGAQGRD